MSAYVIAQVNIINKEPYKEYLKRTTPLVNKYEGEFIVRGGKFENVYGNWNYSRNVIIKFPSYNKAMKWYKSDDYRPVKKIREDNSECNVIIIEGA
tara:strand:+ start:2194 stop:2481 length:288 start_codon:yes stop_codon:yes gene_type:complete